MKQISQSHPLRTKLGKQGNRQTKCLMCFVKPTNQPTVQWDKKIVLFYKSTVWKVSASSSKYAAQTALWKINPTREACFVTCPVSKLLPKSIQKVQRHINSVVAVKILYSKAWLLLTKCMLLCHLGNALGHSSLATDWVDEKQQKYSSHSSGSHNQVQDQSASMVVFWARVLFLIYSWNLLCVLR